MTQEFELERSPRWILLVLGLFGLIAVVGLVFGWRAWNAAQDNRQTLSAEIKTEKQDVDRETLQLQQRLTEAEKTDVQLRDELNNLTKRLGVTQGQLKKTREETAHGDAENVKRLVAMERSVKGELVAKASTEEVKAISGEVAGVRTDLEATKKDLQMARGELGTLIARNHDEIEQLRRLGERDYFEFTLKDKGASEKVGNVTVELRGTNAKKNQFSVVLVVEDKRLEKRNRALNEPIYFFVNGSPKPLELVINKVAKNTVTGYVSVPKA